MSEDFLMVLLAIALVFTGIAEHCRGRSDIIAELCSKQQYDFCEVESTTYKLKN